MKRFAVHDLHPLKSMRTLQDSCNEHIKYPYYVHENLIRILPVLYLSI